MRFGLFYELQLPRPWDSCSEERCLNEALEQIELADGLGIDYVWEVEHHFLEEYSHSSAPEVFLAAASQRTKRVRPVMASFRFRPPSIIPRASLNASPHSTCFRGAGLISVQGRAVLK